MKRMISSILFFILFSQLFGSVTYNNFEAKSEDNNIILSWITTTEINLKEIKILRRTATGQFFEIATLAPKGNNSSYEYIDENAFKTNDSFYAYKLQFVENDDSISESIEIAVSHKTTDVVRTWGSIKALFR